MLPTAWVRTDEWYNFNTDPRGAVHVLATVDETTYSGGTMGADHPIAWCHYYDGGRAWYTAGGHTPDSYSEPLYQAHLLGGILFAAGAVSGYPPLNLNRSGGNLVLSWPAGATGFVPQTATNLQPGAIWIPITNAPLSQNGEQSLVIPSAGVKQFFKLAK
jgi:hypothetical protein